MPPSAKSLILDLLSTLRRDAMPVRALVAAGELFGIPENGIRVALARLVAAETVENLGPGEYRLGRAGSAVRSHVISWRDAGARVVPWGGGWVGVLTAALAPRERRAVRAPRGVRAQRGLRREHHALAWLGFRALRPGLEVRPDNLAGSVAGVRERLRELGLGSEAPVIGISELDPRDAARGPRLWDVAALRRGYRATRAKLDASRGRLTELSPREALVETFVVGGEALHRLALDPLLPEELAPADERRALVEAMRDYDRVGRRYWAAFMSRFGLGRVRTPLELRVTEGPWLSTGGVSA